MKKLYLVFALLSFLLSGTQEAGCIEREIIYYTPKQKTRNLNAWVDDIQFGHNHTVVTLHYLSAGGGANLLPSTKLVCHLRGGETKVLDLRSVQETGMQKDRYTHLGKGKIFRAYFPPLSPADVARIKCVDFIESMVGHGVFHVTDIKIDEKHQVIR